MAHTRNRKRRAYRRLRREAPSTVAVLAEPGDFATMSSRYRSFTFDDHEAYLRQTEVLLRSLTDQGVHTRVACFDAADYALYCEEEQLDPDTAASRTRYTAEVAAAGFTVPYGGETIGRLVPLLLGAREPALTWEEVTALIACAEPGDAGTPESPADPQEYGEAVFRRAVEALGFLLEAAGPGVHHLVCSVSAPDAPLSAALRAERLPEGGLSLRDPEPLLLCGVLAAGMATDSPGGVVVRTCPHEGGSETVRGWRLRGGWLSPLSEAEVFSAYCTDAETGEPVPPEAGVRYRPGIALPPASGGSA
ncbi:hypothetical protein LHJ74_32300 [Streptomyces sp. N2-109]|uniref:Uncharacterized protein n=1 Tax=Streptomyces gossypii TaxID=2883101 RepID=A0ABT2K2Y7_9ACTN|nr:hypothetical protein [Streptomyces gossypii]MCT2594538.1 hypothetical protein [Streptomyces gossypii]